MIQTVPFSTHLAGIVPIAGKPLSFNMPWHDSLIPIHDNYHAVERAIHTAAIAGCNTIWLVCHRESQPFIRKKLGEWVYDPTTVWVPPRTYWNKRDIPVYYVAINSKDRDRRDSLAWSCLYGAKAASKVSLKLSKWVVPKRFLVVSPYGVVDEETIKNSRDLLRGTNNIIFTKGDKTFLDNEHLPFTFDQEQYERCRVNFRENYSGNDSYFQFSDIFSPIEIEKYTKLDIGWHYKLTNWNEYSEFIGSEHNKLCVRPKHMVTHKWWGFVKDH